jgi:hypothetical protein
MSWATCNNASNNIHPNFPAMMDEGNLYTDWNSACKMNNEIKQSAGLNNNYNYRQWLINNATNVMQTNYTSAMGQSCVYNTPTPPTQTSKYIFSGCSDKSQPIGYEHSDLKSLYISKADLQRRMHTPILTQEQLLQRHKPNYN